MIAFKRAQKSAPGQDCIKCKDMRSLTDRDVADLAKVFNRLKNSTFQKDWLHSYLVSLPKTGKKHTRLESHCIVTISNMFERLLETIIEKISSRHTEQFYCFILMSQLMTF